MCRLSSLVESRTALEYKLIRKRRILFVLISALRLHDDVALAFQFLLQLLKETSRIFKPQRVYLGLGDARLPHRV